MIDIDKIIQEKIIPPSQQQSFYGKLFIIPFLRFCLCKKKFDDAKQLSFVNFKGTVFIKALFDYFNFKAYIDNNQIKNIPRSGRLVIVANHPIGSLDGLALLKTISEIRTDVKIIANDWLEMIPHIRESILSVNNIQKSTLKENIKNIYKTLEGEGALIIFPAGEVSRFKFFRGIKDNRWNSGFLRFARAYKVPILPIHIKAKNSFWFYLLSMINYNLSSLWLIREMMKQRNKSLTMTIGQLIPYKSYQEHTTSSDALAQLFKKHLYHLPTKRNLIFQTEETIEEQSIDNEILANALKDCLKLTENDNEIVYQYQAQEDYQNDIVIRELGRCREIAFRVVGEGTGKAYDIDKYDKDFYHLILWNIQESKIMGSYRLGYTKELIKKYGNDGIYCNSIYSFSDEIIPILKEGAELGRSFILPEYWKKGGLKKLFNGIDAWMQQHPSLHYLFGAVSISNNYSAFAKDILVYFYLKHFSAKNINLVMPRYIPYQLNESSNNICQKIFSADYNTDFLELKKQLADLGYSIPSLFKTYTEICQDCSLEFYNFHIDADFSFSVDSFIIVDTNLFDYKKSHHYFPSLAKKSTNAP